MITWRTKKRVWSVFLVPWSWGPEVCDGGEDTWMFTWFCFGIDWLSNDWLDFCERKGGGFSATFEMMKNMMADNDGETKP